MCQSYLSCGPTKILPGGYSACGRCVQPDVFRSIPYDNIACYFIYPCNYEKRNCPEAYVWNEVAIHEKECSYRPGCFFCCRHPCNYGKRPIRYVGDEAKVCATEDILENYLTCIICNGYLITVPIFITVKGASVCHRCGPIINDFELRRNYPLETLLRMFYIKCSFRIRGCTVFLPFGAELEQHEQICEHQHIVRKPSNRPKLQQNPTDPPKKQKGLVPTHRGQIWATVTSNTLYAPDPTLQKQFLNDLKGRKIESNAIGNDSSSVISNYSDETVEDDRSVHSIPTREVQRTDSHRIRNQVERTLSNRVAPNQLVGYKNVLEELLVKQKRY